MLRYKLVQIIIFILYPTAVRILDRGDVAVFVVGIRDGFAVVDKVLDAGRTSTGDYSPVEVFF